MKASNPIYTDREIVEEIAKRKAGGRPPISVSALRKDRIAAQRIPFYRIGRSVRYDLDEVLTAMAAERFGGQPPDLRTSKSRLRLPIQR